MKKVTILITVLFSLISMSAIIAFSGEPTAFDEEKAWVTKNGAETYGQVFRKADDPKKLLILTGDYAFMVDVVDYTIHDVAINSVDYKSEPAIIDYGILSELTDTGLEASGEIGFTFTFKGDKYEVKLEKRYTDPY